MSSASSSPTTPSPASATSTLGPRERCLVAALDVLRDNGPDALSLREVARRAGLSATAPYRHFATKEAMLAALAEQGMQRFEHALRAASPEGLHMMTRARFLEMGKQYVRFARNNPDYYRLMFTSVIPDHATHPALDCAGESAFGVLLQSIELLQRFGEIRQAPAQQLAAHVWSLCHGFASLHLEKRVRMLDPDQPNQPGPPWEDAFEVHFEWLLGGIAGNGPNLGATPPAE